MPHRSPRRPPPARPYARVRAARPSPPPPIASALAWQRRTESDYIFDFWTALGWTILTCGIYGFYVIVPTRAPLARPQPAAASRCSTPRPRSRGSKPQARGLAAELRPAFERIAAELAVLRNQTTRVPRPDDLDRSSRSSGGIVHIIVYILLDGDLVAHDRAEGAIETELSAIYARLGAPVAAARSRRA